MLPEEVMMKEAYVIIQAAKCLSDKLDGVIDLVIGSAQSNKHLIVCGLGKNRMICEKAAATFASMGIPAIYLDPCEALHGSLGMIVADQLIIGISKSGNTPEVIATFDAAGKIGVKLVSITCSESSLLGNICKQYGGSNIYIPCELEADYNNIVPTCSSAVLTAVIDAIGCVASQKLGFTKQQFLDRHPGGTLGNNLKSELNNRT